MSSIKRKMWRMYYINKVKIRGVFLLIINKNNKIKTLNDSSFLSNHKPSVLLSVVEPRGDFIIKNLYVSNVVYYASCENGLDVISWFDWLIGRIVCIVCNKFMLMESTASLLADRTGETFSDLHWNLFTPRPVVIRLQVFLIIIENVLLLLTKLSLHLPTCIT